MANRRGTGGAISSKMSQYLLKYLNNPRPPQRLYPPGFNGHGPFTYHPDGTPKDPWEGYNSKGPLPTSKGGTLWGPGEGDPYWRIPSVLRPQSRLGMGLAPLPKRTGTGGNIRTGNSIFFLLQTPWTSHRRNA